MANGQELDDTFQEVMSRSGRLRRGYQRVFREVLPWVVVSNNSPRTWDPAIPFGDPAVLMQQVK